MSETPLWDKAVTVATWALVVLTFAAVRITYLAYKDSAETNRRATATQAHALAVSLLQDYMKLAVEKPALASNYESTQRKIGAFGSRHTSYRA